jgi:light-regulated signal transduction histidine kinase (bacteriophytochrome)
MVNQRSGLERTGLEFFGRMSASISHEIKNTLAIINESAGLLRDLVLMAKNGHPLSTERLDHLAGTLNRQVNRADMVVRKMNRFSHSIDTLRDDIDLHETMVFLSDISGRIFTLENLSIEIIPPLNRVTVFTDPFHLQNLVWRCLNFMARASVSGKTLRLKTQQLDMGAEIKCSCEGQFQKISLDSFPSENERVLLAYLGAELKTEASRGEIRILLPKRVQ